MLRPARTESVEQEPQTVLVSCSKFSFSRSSSETFIHLFHHKIFLNTLQLHYRTSFESSLIGCPTWKRLLTYHKSSEKSVFLMSCFHVLRFYQDFPQRRLPLEMTGTIYADLFWCPQGQVKHQFELIGVSMTYEMDFIKSISADEDATVLCTCFTGYWGLPHKELTFYPVHLVMGKSIIPYI